MRIGYLALLTQATAFQTAPKREASILYAQRNKYLETLNNAQDAVVTASSSDGSIVQSPSVGAPPAEVVGGNPYPQSVASQTPSPQQPQQQGLGYGMAQAPNSYSTRVPQWPPQQQQNQPPPPQTYQPPPQQADPYSNQPYSSNVAEVVQGIALERRLAEVEKEASNTNKLLAAASFLIGLPVAFLFGSTFNDNEASTPPPPAVPPPVVQQAATPPAPVVESSPPKMALPSSEPISHYQVRQLFNLWNDALKTGDPSKVADRYAREGTLLPTLSDKPRYDYDGIRDYFVGFLKKQPVGKILEGEIMVGNNWAQDAGRFYSLYP